MCCFVILLLSNEMQMSVRRFSAIPHLRAFTRVSTNPRNQRKRVFQEILRKLLHPPLSTLVENTDFLILSGLMKAGLLCQILHKMRPFSKLFQKGLVLSKCTRVLEISSILVFPQCYMQERITACQN